MRLTADTAAYAHKVCGQAPFEGAIQAVTNFFFQVLQILLTLMQRFESDFISLCNAKIGVALSLGLDEM